MKIYTLGALCVLCLFLTMGCNNSQKIHTVSPVDDFDKSKPTKVEFVRDTLQPQKEEHLTPQQLYSEVERRRDATLQLLEAPSTQTRIFNQLIGSDEAKITFYFRQNKILAIVSVVFNSEGRKLSYNTYYFDENNNCDMYIVKKDKDSLSKTYLLRNHLIVELDSNLNPLIVDDSVRQSVLKSAKVKLDSIMVHFESYKYSIDW